jgi:hypothetical protein
MKIVLLYVGVVMCLIGIFSSLQYIFDYPKLSDYGKGFIWGKVVIILIGITFIAISRKKDKAKQ